MGGTTKHDKADKKSSGRASIRAGMRKIAEAERTHGGPDRGMPLHTKVNLTAIAQGEDDVDMPDQEKELSTLVTQLMSIQGLMSTYST